MRREPERRRAFSLIELVASVGAATVIVLSVGSVLALAGRSVPGGDDAAAAGVSAWGAADRFAHDLSTALACTATNPWTLTVPDRDGDGANEEVVWDWDNSGPTMSYALSRIENGGDPVVVISRAKAVSVLARRDGATAVALRVTVTAGDTAGTTASVTTPVWNLAAWNGP